ncbi:MAG: hypothetical protein WC563_15170 [Brevundimonas sp.]
MIDLHVWTNGTDTCVAASADDARTIAAELTGESLDDYPADEWSAYPDDHVLRIWHEENDTVECGCKALHEQDSIERQAPREAWVRLEKLIQSMGGKMDLPFPSEVDTGRRFDPCGHEQNCPKGSDSKTCAQWVASDGRGFLCSTEY